ncbi:leucine-rich repeat-containing protein (LRR) [Tieghemostelium lacteum]|uniref:Leucine-rich repeat-containing protein (LRR) n=1 Tax=Tieghemostelium lacteum TaxID=361077 RepID=A0A151Z9Q4_TIELA|nr:leucine-rich repeat-containing protein (LRR) [Tieghemostelium lacteum]|eukprot:KYQ90678.1 leucine-rich repeat-containing protein (LRR) [Tieghemostelium lacteum]
MTSNQIDSPPLEVLESDQAFIDEQIGPLGGIFGEEITCQCPVSVTRNDKDTQLNQRILVVGKYKLLLIKKTKFNKKVKKSIHLYDLIEISEPLVNLQFPDTIEIKYKDAESNSISTFLLKAASRQIESIIIKTLAITTYSISKGFPQEVLLRINLPLSRYQPLKFDHNFGVDGKGIAEQYIAHSHYFKRKATLDFLRHLETLYQTRYPVLDLTQIPGIDASCSLGFNLFTSIICLRHNPFIRSLRISSVPHINVVSSVGEMLQTNTTITEIVICNLLTEQSFTPLGHALAMGNCNIQVLDISNNMMNYESVSMIIEGLSQYHHSLVSLNMSKCNIPPKGIALLFECFEKNLEMSLTVETLDLSDNRFQDSGSAAFASWISKTRGFNSLTKLILQNTQLNLTTLSPPFRTLKLESLDISRNSINLSSAKILSSECLECLSSLKYLSMTSCSLIGDSVQLIIVALGKSQKVLSNLQLNIASNSFAAKTANILSQLLPEYTYISGLDLSFNNFNTKQLVDILGSLHNNKQLKALDIGHNSFNSNDEQLMQAVVSFVHNHQSLEKLGLGCINRPLGQSLHNLIQFLAINKSITALDLTGNDLNDHGACLLADTLRQNKILKKLFIAGNKFTAVGWDSLASPFVYFRNTTLIHMELPQIHEPILQSDSIQAILPLAKRQQMEDLFFRIRMQLTLNKSKVPSSSRYQYLPQHDPPIYIKPKADVPDHLRDPNQSSNSNLKIITNGTGSLRLNSPNQKASISSIFSKPLTLLNIDLQKSSNSELPNSNSIENGLNTISRKFSISSNNSSTWKNDDESWKNQDHYDNEEDLK